MMRVLVPWNMVQVFVFLRAIAEAIRQEDYEQARKFAYSTRLSTVLYYKLWKMAMNL